MGLSILASVGSRGSFANTNADLTVVPLFDGRQTDLLNTWGGAWGIGNLKALGVQTRRVHSGPSALVLDLGPTKAAESRYLQCFASGFGPGPQYRQTRDLTRYKQIGLYVFNVTHAALRGRLELKDYRDSRSHGAVYRFDLSAAAAWTPIVVPVDLTSVGWNVVGSPDLTRLLTIDFCFEPTADLAGGEVFVDDVMLTERGQSVDVNSAPLPMLVERLARRQWDGLWDAQGRDHHLIANTSYQVTDAGLNATSTVLWMLPEAVRRHWLSRCEADQYVAALLQSINRLLDRATHIPPRNVDWVTMKPSLLPEESSVDAAFLALALHQYKSLPATSPALRREIHETENRFDFAAFSCPSGWRMAYRYATPRCPAGFTSNTYDGYTNEGNLISLAAHLSQRHHVPIETHWNRTAYRVCASLAPMSEVPIVHAMPEFRSPFTQALWNLFVDVRERGVDCYPDGHLAVNPWHNFVCYEQHVMARLASTGRACLLQPDAGDDGTLNCYRQFSVYEDFGQHDLFMPWSAALPLLAGVRGSEEAIRFLLQHRLDGPMGLVDSARWVTGAPEPHAIATRCDYWSTGLSTMALLEWLGHDARSSKSFASLPEVRTALDRVFPAPPAGQKQLSQGGQRLKAAG
jgi:hypothetical protein